VLGLTPAIAGLLPGDHRADRTQPDLSGCGPTSTSSRTLDANIQELIYRPTLHV
jgi:hypothetical protein